MTSIQQLATAGVRADRAGVYAPLLNAAMDKYLINTPDREAYFLANVIWESQWLRYTRELWGPTPSQASYETRHDLGNNQPGDGYRYRGGGLIEITGRANFAECGAALGIDLEAHPELIEQPNEASMSAGWFWFRHALSPVADAEDFTRCVKIINGGLNGIEHRLDILARLQSPINLQA